DCRERGRVALDLNGVRAGFDSALTAFPGAHVRPVIVYVDDVDLPTSAETLAALHAARSLSDPPALIWTISHAPVAGKLPAAHPPTITFTVPQLVATPKSLFKTSTFDMTVEGCTANCDRYYVGEPGADPVRWDEAGRCLLRNG